MRTMRTMLISVLVVCVTVITVSTVSTASTSSEEKCTCIALYSPVCGEDGTTYSNQCRMKCAGVGLRHAGECRSSKDTYWDGGITVERSKVSGEQGDTTGDTTNPCNCPPPGRDYRPVCGSDGRTYDNDCWVRCAGQRVRSTGRCPESCICTDVYEPVCGDDWSSYDNACKAQCEGGAGIAYEGPCIDEQAQVVGGGQRHLGAAATWGVTGGLVWGLLHWGLTVRHL